MNVEQFKKEIEGKKVLVDFYAQWCGPCKMMMGVLGELEAEGHNILKIDIEESPELTKEYGVMSVPTLILFKDGEPFKQVTGFQPKDLLEDLLAQ